MTYKFQVSIMDKKDYIVEWKNFEPREIDRMLKYINKHVTLQGATIKITRWNEQGDRA